MTDARKITLKIEITGLDGEPEPRIVEFACVEASAGTRGNESGAELPPGGLSARTGDAADAAGPGRAASSASEAREPPHLDEAEQSVLGGLLLDNAAFDRIADIVYESDFYRDEHRRIFRHIGKLLKHAKPADAITVAESLDLAGEGTESGGLAYLGELTINTPSASNIRRHAKIVREYSIRRQLLSACEEIAGSIFHPLGRDAQQLLDEAEARVFAIAESGFGRRNGFQHVNPLLTQFIEHIQELHDRGDPSAITGLPTGYRDLDMHTQGMQRGDLIVVTGYRSTGKTTFALNIAEHTAVETGLPVAVFSMETGGMQLALRLLSSAGRLDAQGLRFGRLENDEWSRLSSALGKLHEAPLYISETPALNQIELRARARRLNRQCGKLGLIVIDSLQSMSHFDLAMPEITRTVKSLALELKVPILALSQLQRAAEERSDPRPMLCDLQRDIRQDADLILFLHRDEVYAPGTLDGGIAEVIIGKQRNGPTGTVRLSFRGECLRFENYAAPGTHC